MTAKSRARKVLKKIHNKEKTNGNPRKLDRKGPSESFVEAGNRIHAEAAIRAGLESGRADRITRTNPDEEVHRPVFGYQADWPEFERNLREYPAIGPEEDAKLIEIERKFLKSSGYGTGGYGA